MPSNYVLLRKVTLTATTASITFSNIPSSGYTDLKFTASARSSDASLATGGYVAFNGITTDFTTRYMYGNGSVATRVTGGREFGSMPGSTATANAFSNSEVIIPNYLSSDVKGYSVDTVTETNGAEIYAYMFSGVWSNSTAINSITYSPAGGSFVAGSSFCLYGIAAAATTPALAPFATGGDTVANDGTYWYHAFVSSGTFTPAKALTCDVLRIAGGGGGAGNFGGGGGAGGLLYTSGTSLTALSNHPVLVGAGGADIIVGNNSEFGSLTVAIGGGAGGGGTNTGGVAAQPQQAGGNGGGGGGNNGVVNQTATVGGVGSQGFNGGTGKYDRYGGGGAGAGGAGNNAAGSNSGNGGVGVNTYSAWASATGTGASGYYAGGGGGGAYSSTAGTGSNGGGNGGVVSNDGTAATAFTGSGGGGGGGNNSGGNGASGIVIVRYLMV